jgi:hypothetical protein
MNYRFYLTIGSSEIEVFPLNFLKTTLVDTREQGQIFYRRKFNGTLRFYNDAKLGITDFTLINLVETLILAGSLDCQDLLLRIEQKNSGANTYHTYWEGHFSTSDGKFDLDNCTFEVTPLPNDDYKNFDKYGELEYNILDVLLTVTTSTTVTYTRNRWLMDVIEFLVRKVTGTATTVSSLIMTAVTNYVTGGNNVYTLLTIAQKSDIKRPASSNPARLAMLSFNELMDILKMFNWRWIYNEDDDELTIEHISFWNAGAGLDLRTQAIAEKSNKYDYDKNNMPRIEQFDFMEAGDSNYTTHTIWYDSECVKNETKYQYSNRVTTDIEWIELCASLGEDTNIDDDGFVILANYLDGGYKVYKSSGYESITDSYNCYLSWSYLLRMFFMHDRVWPSGFIQGTPIDFLSVRKIKTQETKAIICWEDDYDPNDYMTTELGEDYFDGQKGYIKTLSLKPSGEASIILQYGLDIDADVVMPNPIKTIHLYVYCVEGSYYEVELSEPNIYDSYFWIWINETTCQEVIVPAGVTFQTEPLDADCADSDTEIKVNILDPSLDGWFWQYNDTGDPPDVCANVDCGGAAPPVAPAATTMVSVVQVSNCSPVVATWNASAGATYYEVWRAPLSYSPFNHHWGLITTRTTLSYSDTTAGLNNAVSVEYKVKACNITGCSADSDVMGMTPACLGL